jgi:hypothetical protein
MSNKPFDKPIYLRLPHDGRFRAWNVWEGLDYLERFWTGPKDIHYERAKKLCESALDGFTTPSRARGALVDAARHANLLLDAPRSDRTFAPTTRGQRFASAT